MNESAQPANPPTNVVFIGAPGDLPDVWTEVINHLPATTRGWPVANTGQPVDNLEQVLDKQELRDVAIVAAAGGAVPASLFAARQPQRVNKLVLVNPILGLDAKTISTTRKMLRFLPNFLFKRRGTSKKEVIDGMVRAHEELKGVAAPVVVYGDTKQSISAAEFLGAELVRKSADHTAEADAFVALIQPALQK